MRYVEVNAKNAPAFCAASKKGSWVVLHHMNGCMHCMMFKPTWNDAVASCSKVPVNVASVEYSDMKRLPPTMQKVNGFPTVMVYVDGKPKAAFSGDRTVEDVSQFFKSYAAKPIAAKPIAAKPVAAKPVAKKKI